MSIGVLAAVWTGQSPTPERDVRMELLRRQREQLLARMRDELHLTPGETARVRAIVFGSPILGQGNPELSVHPMTSEECVARRESAKHLALPNPRCGKPNMVPVFDPEQEQTAETADRCIDQYEFPNIPCQYPVVHVTALEAAELCDAVGKRLCDAHEWEGACAGQLLPADEEYAWGQPRREMTRLHNTTRERVWAYGPEQDLTKCAMQSAKTPGCGGGFNRCGTNSYPSGAFPECVSPFGVYDQHGNVAEHMNLPLNIDQLARYGELGQTEMKGSWFIFASWKAHEDDCRWRAPDWHVSAVLDSHSHSNYHLGFRCCRDIPEDRAATLESLVPEGSAQQRNPVE